MKENCYRAWNKKQKKMYYDGDFYSEFDYTAYELKNRYYPCQITNKGILSCNKLSQEQTNDYVGITKDNVYQTYYSRWESEQLYSQNLIIQQFTGYIDKNNKKIYEDDIVKVCKEYGGYAYIPLVVDFADGCFVLRPINNLNSCSPMFKYDFNQIHEVIGNKYENPELMIF